MMNKIFFSGLFLFASLGTFAKASWVLIMDADFLKKDIIRLIRPITNIHDPYFVKEQGRYVLLVADDSAELATFYNRCMVRLEMRGFPYTTYDYIDQKGKEYLIHDYEDTVMNRDLDRRVFSIDGHWMNYINIPGRKYCHWEFFTKNNSIEGKFIQYNREKKLFQFVTYKKGIKEGPKLSLRINGDTVCLEQFHSGIRILGNCYDENKRPYDHNSIKERIDKTWDYTEHVIREYQTDSIGQLDGRYRKTTFKGNILEEGEFKHSLPEGTWKYYDDYGNLIKIKTYHKGEEIR